MADVAHSPRCNTCACDSSDAPVKETLDVSAAVGTHGLEQRRCIQLLPRERPSADTAVAHDMYTINNYTLLINPTDLNRSAFTALLVCAMSNVICRTSLKDDTRYLSET